jgi:hypothetical protein
MPEPLVELHAILADLDVAVRDELYVFAAVEAGASVLRHAHATVCEDEAVTIVLPVARADEHDLVAQPAFAWLTLTVHSSLEAVGLTAAFSAVLADAGISCNVLAGFHHDHLLVPAADRDRAVAVLRALRP